jgi:acetyl esterase
MTLNPALLGMLAAMAEAPPTDWNTVAVESVRAMYGQQLNAGAPIAMACVSEHVIPVDGAEIPARLYVPEGAGETPPLTVYFHGGGWVIGDIDTHDGTCRALARASKVAVLSVGYRLAPEHRYPTAALDCYAATEWASRHGALLGVDGARIAVAGDSAGGNLAAAVAIMARDQGGPALRHQLLIYPVTDDDFSMESYGANGGGNYFLSTQTMQWFWNQYLGNEGSGSAPLARVLRTENLSDVAPATVITAEYDPLRDEGAAYADRLTHAGVATDYHCAPGMIHGFYSMFAYVPDVLKWIDKGGYALRQALA